jgi:hypothetical protein
MIVEKSKMSFNCSAEFVNTKLSALKQRGVALQNLLQTNPEIVQKLMHAMLRDKRFFINGSKPSQNIEAVKSTTMVFANAAAKAMQLVGDAHVDVKTFILMVPPSLNQFDIGQTFRKNCKSSYNLKWTPEENSYGFMSDITHGLIPQVLQTDAEVGKSMKPFAAPLMDQKNVRMLVQNDVKDETQQVALVLLSIIVHDFCLVR